MEEPKIRAIRRYLSQNGVKYYDVQAELIDHFATAVEKIERENPDIRFKVALLKAHRSFGGREGFRKYILQAEKDVQNKVWKMVLQTLVHFLSWPYMLLTAAIVLIWHFALTIFSPDSSIVILSFTAAFLAVLLRNYLTLREVPMFLPKSTTRALGWIFYAFAYLPGYSGWLSNNYHDYGYSFSLIYFSFLSLLLIAFYRVPALAVRETKKLYPKMA